MTAPSRPWQRLKDLAENRRDAIGRTLADATARRDGAKSRLAMLLDYRSEYEARLNRATLAGIDAGRLRNFHRFLAQLDQAITQQESQTAAAQSSVESARGAWQGQQREVQSFDTLGKRARAAHATRERRQEQKEQDAYASTPRAVAPALSRESR
ncbi:MAG: flagellar export protein FliJ [Burkholderiales bacterium]|nr:flagellar export protein FliJ [Burkholderiales bacterium]MCE7876094.1 flagellar export protein FliJ [Betaproteobacteria bacterium PRO3]